MNVARKITTAQLIPGTYVIQYPDHVIEVRHADALPYSRTAVMLTDGDRVWADTYSDTDTWTLADAEQINNHRTGLARAGIISGLSNLIRLLKDSDAVPCLDLRPQVYMGTIPAAALHDLADLYQIKPTRTEGRQHLCIPMDGIDVLFQAIEVPAAAGSDVPARGEGITFQDPCLPTCSNPALHAEGGHDV